VDVIEGTARAPITIVMRDHSISVAGSTNVQIGNANQQNFVNHVASLMSAIDRMEASEPAKKEAKGLIEKISSNPLVIAVITAILGKSISE